MFQVAENTCVCNVTQSNIDLSGVWIDHVRWDSSNGAFTCRGRNTMYRMMCSRMTEAGINMNEIIFIFIVFIVIVLLLAILLIVMLKKGQKCEKCQE